MFDAPATPADPPRAAMYNTELLKGQGALLAIVKVPAESVVTGELRSAVGADPLPVMPAAYSCTLELTIGNAPARTVPLKFATA